MIYDINEYPYFVMLHMENSSGKFVALPMQDDDGDIVHYETAEDAEDAAANNTLGANFGYEVFMHGNGE